MKALLVNGSPRKGNTYAALSAIEEGLRSAGGVEIDNIVLQDQKIAPCMACDACRGNGGNCVIGDDGNDLIEKLYHADILVLGSPVYWWGVTAQLKLFLDRMYSKGEGKLTNKKLGIVITGGDGLQNVQYDLISGQLRASLSLGRGHQHAAHEVADLSCQQRLCVSHGKDDYRICSRYDHLHAYVWRHVGDASAQAWSV